jgi:hypothetical protein
VTSFWGDETGLRSDDVRGRGYAPPGRTPEVRVNHKRANLGLISAVTNKGELRWMVLDGAITAPDLLRFLARLVRDAGQKVFLRICTRNNRAFRVGLDDKGGVGLVSPCRADVLRRHLERR